MAILSFVPNTKQAKRAHATFLGLVGECVTQWAFVDRAFFRTCHGLLGTDVKTAGIIYYRFSSLGSKAGLANDLVSHHATPRLLKTWKRLIERLNALVPIRNIIVHHPILRAGGGKRGRERYQYFIRIEPYEVESGRRKPQAVSVTMLRRHARDTERLSQDLHRFASRISALAKSRRKNAAS